MTISNFTEIAKSVVIHSEGGFNDFKQDKGGATNFGISLRFLKSLDVADADITGDGHVDIDDIQNMSMEAALGFYKEHFWDHYNIHQFMVPALQRKMFSLLINMRGRTAMKCAQRALRSLGEPIVDDGYFGRKSLAAWNRVLSRQGANPLISSIRSEAAGVYRLIVKANPDQGLFLDGWLNRAYE